MGDPFLDFATHLLACSFAFGFVCLYLRKLHEDP